MSKARRQELRVWQCIDLGEFLQPPLIDRLSNINYLLDRVGAHGRVPRFVHVG